MAQQVDLINQKCGNCKFWLATAGVLPGSPEGMCRHDPPTGTAWGSYRWPPCREDEWCGDWEITPAFLNFGHCYPAGSGAMRVDTVQVPA